MRSNTMIVKQIEDYINKIEDLVNNCIPSQRDMMIIDIFRKIKSAFLEAHGLKEMRRNTCFYTKSDICQAMYLHFSIEVTTIKFEKNKDLKYRLYIINDNDVNDEKMSSQEVIYHNLNLRGLAILEKILFEYL